MRRALLAALAGLALPATALAQNVGTIGLPTGFTSINLAQCTGVTNPVVGDDLNVDLTWNINPGSGIFTGGGTVRLYALKQQPGAGQSSGTNTTSCTTTVNGDAITPATIVPDTDGTSDITVSAQTDRDTFSLQEIVAGAGIDCAAGSGTVYLCVQWNPGSNPTAGFAVVNMNLDTAPPGKPTSVSTSPGDSTLHVKAHVDSTATSCKAIATSTADPGTHSSGRDACDSMTIKDLRNEVEYSVVVYAIDDANNPSVASDAVAATPFPTEDFWNHYKDDGGQEKGGCSTAAGGAGLLASLLGLLAVRRRKP